MRRGLHCLLVGVLTFSMSVDTAKACWHRRRSLACPPAACYGSPVPVAGWAACPPFSYVPAHVGGVSMTGACGPCLTVVDASGFVTDHVTGYEILGSGITDSGITDSGILGYGITGYEEVACGQAIACCGDTEATIVAETTGIPTQIGEQVVGEQVGELVVEQNVESVTKTAEPTLAAVGPEKAETVPAAEAAPITIPPQSVAVADKPAAAPAVELTAVPERKSVEPVTALEPAAPQPTTDAPAPAEPPAAPPEPVAPQPPAEPSKPKEENIFEEVETAANKPAAAEPTGPDAPAPVGEPDAKPAPEPAPTPVNDPAFDPAKEPVQEPVQEPAKEPTSEPAATEPGASPAEPAATPASEPVEPPATDDKPAAEPAATDAARSTPREPLRRWIDATGSYATVGRFVELRDDAIEIQKANGRTILVPLDRLSSHDRGYAVEAGARLAARRASGPAASETAGL